MKNEAPPHRNIGCSGTSYSLYFYRWLNGTNQYRTYLHVSSVSFQ